MPYYKTIDEVSVPSSINGANSSLLQSRMFYENIGFRSRAPKRGNVTLIPNRTAEPMSWFESNNTLKQRNYTSAHPELASLFKKDKGHTWDLATCDITGGPFSYAITRNGLFSSSAVNVGILPVVTTGFVNPLVFDTVGTTVSSYAALEYGRTAPTSDQISMSAIIGELREGLPALIPLLLTTGSRRNFKETLKRQSRRVRDAGGDYLNVQFGWIPLLSDVRKIATALAVATVAISGNHLSTHRRRDKPERDSTVESSSGSFNAVNRFVSTGFVGSGTNATTTFANGTTYRSWKVQRHQVDLSFEAEFIRLPEGQKDYSSYLDRLDELMRFDITPMDLWQLAPWSWLVDWFFDIGAQLDAWNSATSNRILSLYAYGMRDERLTTTIVLSDVRASATYGYTGPSTVYQQIVARRRQRIRANPFGFTPDPLTQLSAGQLAILAALGLTKTRR